jgi:hypothetical protein
MSLPMAALAVGGTTILIALIALKNLGECYHKDLDYLEED